MKKKEQILREEIRRVIKQILEAEEAPEDQMPEEEPEEEPEEAPTGDEEDVDSGELINKFTGKFINKLKEMPDSDDPENIINVVTKVVGGFGMSKDEMMMVLKRTKNNLIQ
jgi:hypothetical protein